jgi:hypothetical protein
LAVTTADLSWKDELEAAMHMFFVGLSIKKTPVAVSILHDRDQDPIMCVEEWLFKAAESTRRLIHVPN